MKLNWMGRGMMAAMGSLGMVLGLTACTRDYVVSYLYVTSAKGNPGVVNQYQVDYQTGALTPIGTPAQAGSNPVTLVAAPNGMFIYVINQGDSSVQEFAVQGDGSLVSKNVYKNTAGSPANPVAASIDGAGKFLYVAYTYFSGSSGVGGVSIYPINGDNSLGTPTSIKVGNNPIGIVASAQFCEVPSAGVSNSNPSCTTTGGAPGNITSSVYVLDREPAAGTVSQHGVILGYSQNSSTGALTPVTGGNASVGGVAVPNGFTAGVVPSAITEDPSARFVYVTDQATNQLIGYLVLNGGTLSAMTNGPFPVGLFPVAVTVDPRGKYLYTANFNAGSISAFAINTANGTPASVSSANGSQAAIPTDPGPTCITIEPALGLYLYTSNSIANDVSAEKLDPHNGALTSVQNTPFPASGLPTCAVTIPNGAHATQIINP
jgi:6-phosphogluconolactonase